MSESPRWRLRGPHYLNVPGTEWEQRETDSITGRMVRKAFSVPLLLDPDNPQDRNYSDGIYVTYEKKAHSSDYVFVGDPTPDMEPMNEAAEAITERLRPTWEHPIESLTNKVEFDEATKALMAAFAGQTATVPRSEFEALKAQLDELMAKVGSTAERRV